MPYGKFRIGSINATLTVLHNATVFEQKLYKIINVCYIKNY